MPQVSSYVPASFVFPEGDNDFDGFKSLIKGLSRTDTILWCSRLNLMLANPHLDERKKQQYAVSLFFDSTETARLKTNSSSTNSCSRAGRRETKR